MSATANPFIVGQVWKQTDAYGLQLYTYFCEWDQSTASFFYTKVFGGMNLETSRTDQEKAQKPIGAYDELVNQMGAFLTKDKTGRIIALWGRDQIKEELSKRREQQRKSLEQLSKR